MIVRSFGTSSGSAFRVTDWSEELNVIPNQWGTIGALGIFAEESVAEHTVTFEETTVTGGVILDRVRGERANVNAGSTRRIHAFAVPHFPLDDYISPQDLQGIRAYGSQDVEQLSLVRTRKMMRLAQDHAWTLEVARAQALTLGTVYAPNGTVVQNWNTEFGITRTQVDFLLGTSTTEVIQKVEAVIAQIQDNAFGAVPNGVVVLCSPGFFAKLIAHPMVKLAYTYYTTPGAQEPLRNRLGLSSAFDRHRKFEFAGATFIELRDAYNGTPLLPAGNAYAVPTGTDAFKTYFSPANRFGLVNTLGEKTYMFETEDPKGTRIEIESEANHVSALLRPQLVVNCISSN